MKHSAHLITSFGCFSSWKFLTFEVVKKSEIGEIDSRHVQLFWEGKVKGFFLLQQQQKGETHFSTWFRSTTPSLTKNFQKQTLPARAARPFIRQEDCRE